MNKFFISINLILCVAVSVISVLPAVQEALPRSGLLQSSMVSLYTIYLTWSAVANNPSNFFFHFFIKFLKLINCFFLFKDQECNPGFLGTNGGHNKVTFDTTSIIGLIIWMLCVLYSSLRSASKVAQVTIPDPEKQGLYIEKFKYWNIHHSCM